MDLVPYNSKSNHKQKKGGVSFRERLERLAKSSLKQGQILSKEAFRRAKVVRSSAFEGMLLKATWPSNDPVQPEILNEIVKYSIPAFKFSSSNSDDDPYYMTMHKLWTKMYEKDWRTIAKSLHILHTIARDCQPDACERFSFAIRDMAKTRNPKKPDHRYFDANCLSDLEDNSREYEEYIQAYAKYVIYRMKSFTGKYDELSKMNNKISEKKIIAMLSKAQQCVSLALETADTLEKSQLTVITGHNTKLLVLDLIDLWTILGEKISSLLLLSSDVTISNSNAVMKILQFYKDFDRRIDQFILNASKSYMKLRIKIPSKIDKSTSVAEEAIMKRIAQLTSLHGGYVIRDAEEVARSLNGRERLISKSKYEEEDDDEDDEEDGDDEDGDEDDDEDSKDGDDEEEGIVDEEVSEDDEDEDEVDNNNDDDNSVDEDDSVEKGVIQRTSRKPESADTDYEEEEEEEEEISNMQDADVKDDEEEEKVRGDTEDDEDEDEDDEEDDEEEKDDDEEETIGDEDDAADEEEETIGDEDDAADEEDSDDDETTEEEDDSNDDEEEDDED